MRTNRRTVLQVSTAWRQVVNRVAGRDEDPEVDSVIVTEGGPEESRALAVLLPCLPDGTVDLELVDEHNAAAARARSLPAPYRSLDPVLDDAERRAVFGWPDYV